MTATAGRRPNPRAWGATRDLGHDTGEVLAIFKGGTITKMRLTARVGLSDHFVYGDGDSCALHVSS
jgi:hypothetical protein